MPDIPKSLFNSLKIALKQCRDKFFSQQDIWYALDNEKLRTWRDSIPEADNYDKRLENVISYLKNKENIHMSHPKFFWGAVKPEGCRHPGKVGG
jgi:hypothetical protein